MSFELKPDESIRKGIRRIVRKQIDPVLEMLRAGREQSRDEAVHEARKAFKKVRAVLRLVRPEIGARTYRRENFCFRDSGRPLTEVRDARILIETLDKLTEQFQEHLAGRSFGNLRQALQANLRDVKKRVLEDQDAFAVVAEIVRQARERIKDWTNVPNRWRSVGAGLEDVCRRACSAFEEAAADPTIENLHEWRKQAKYLRYQLEILRPLWPERLKELAKEADRMSDLLGDDHDLAVLRQMVASDPERFHVSLAPSGDGEVLLALIDRSRADLEQEALLLGRRFFQDRPKDLVRRLKGYWKSSRAMTRSEQLPAPQ